MGAEHSREQDRSDDEHFVPTIEELFAFLDGKEDGTFTDEVLFAALLKGLFAMKKASTIITI